MGKHYYKELDNDNIIVAIGILGNNKTFTNGKSIVVIEHDEYKEIFDISTKQPNPSDDAHEIRIKDNLDGTYNYVEVLKPIEEIVEE